MADPTQQNLDEERGQKMVSVSAQDMAGSTIIQPAPFIGLPRDKRRIIEDLEITNLKDTATKNLYGLLTSGQKTDLTDGNETSLHTHAAATPASHASSHQNGGGDEISVADLSGELADDQKAHVTRGQQVISTSADVEFSCGFAPKVVQLVTVGHRNTGGGGMTIGTANSVSTEGCVWSEIGDSGDSSYDGSNIITLYTADGVTKFAEGDVKTMGTSSFTIQWTTWDQVAQVVVNWIAWG